MKKLTHFILKILILTILILCSYSYVERHALVQRFQKWMHDTATEYLTPEEQKSGTGTLTGFMSLCRTRISAVPLLQKYINPADSSTSAWDHSVRTVAAAAADSNTGSARQDTTEPGTKTAGETPESEAAPENNAAADQAAEKTRNLEYKAVWLSYLEFMDYLDSVEENTEENFRDFFNHVADRAKEAGMNRIIVQVRPFGDALYPSKYFPWSSCISGVQGRNPGYDPLKNMVDIAHKKGLAIEAWINPYRILSTNDISILAPDNPALIWLKSKNRMARGRVLQYDGALYYNPSRASVRKLIKRGICEIINNYQVDGIHMDDYFYPDFTEENVFNSFDFKDYRKYSSTSSSAFWRYRNGKNNIFDWRRNNVSLLVSDIYRSIKAINPNITFGISPNGSLEDLRSNYQHYADVDRWVTEPGYVDYLMPQLYWGYSNEYSPYKELLDQWADLMADSTVKLYIGLPLYRMAAADSESPDAYEFEHADLFHKMLRDINRKDIIKGITLFSYEYLDVDNKKFLFYSTEYSEDQKKILRDVFQIIKKFSRNTG